MSAVSIIEPPAAPARAEEPAVPVAALPAEPAVQVTDLWVKHGRTEAVRGVSLTVERGRVLALLGPNGAGKTSIVSVLAGLNKRSGGEVRVLGEDPGRARSDWRARIGIVLQHSEAEPQLTVRECLELYAGYYPDPRPVDELLDLVELTEFADRRCGRLSGGEQRRVDVALALIGRPEVLFLDEPTTGFDPIARRAAWDLLERLRAMGTTMLLTTHYLEEAEQLADRISVLVDGQIRADEVPSRLGGRDRHPSRVSFELPDDLPADALDALPGALEASVEEGRAMLMTHDPAQLLHHLTGWATTNGHALRSLAVAPPTLEDVYTELIGDSK